MRRATGATRATRSAGATGATRRSPATRAARALGLGAAAGTAWLLWRRLTEAPISLGGRVVVITGGSRGLGLVLAREFAAHGCRLAICARDAEELERARRDLVERGADVYAAVCDVADEPRVRAFLSDVVARYGRVDVLVNNAGIIQVGPLETMSAQDFRHALDVNFFGALHTTLAVMPLMIRRHAGRIVNITSIGGKVAVPHLLPYDCAKFAAVALSEGTRAELARHGIKVTTVVPGLMRTGSPPNALFKGKASLEYTWFALGDATPLTATSAERAARRIVEATRRGEAEVTLTWQARALRLVAGVLPGALADGLGAVNRLLPEPGGIGSAQLRGRDVANALTRSPVTALLRRAARRNNELAAPSA